MIAVSRNIPIQIAPVLLAQTAPFQLGTSPGTSGLGGFTDLINLLLASAGPEPESTPAGNVALADNPSITGAPSLGAASNATSEQVASALIRFMTKSKGVSASRKSPSDQEIASILAAATGSGQNNFIPGVLNSVGSIVAAALQGAALAPPLQVGQDGMSKGPDVNELGGGSGVKAGIFPKMSEASSNPKAPVAFEMQLTPVTEPKAADSQITVSPGPLVAHQGAPVTQTARLAPSAGPAKPAAAVSPDAAPDAAPVTRSRQEAPGTGENPGNTGSQAKPRQEEPAKALGAVAAALGSDGRAPGNTVQAGFLNAAPAQTAPSPGSPTESKNIQVSSTPLSAADTKDLSAGPQRQSGQTHQIEVRISQPQEPIVDLQIAQRAGQIQVVVRTPDAGLEASLRQDLNTLVHSLERSGFHTETFVPIAATSAADSSRMNAQRDPQQGQPDSARDGSPGQNGGQNSGHNPGRGSGGNSRGNAFRDPEQSEALLSGAWTNSGEEQS